MGLFQKMLSYIGLQEEEEIIQQERYEEPSAQEETGMNENRKSKNKIVSIHTQKSVRLVLAEPRSYEDAQEIADHLRSRRPVIVNLQRVRSDQAVRIVDFLSGTVYALSGHISKVGPSIFVCTPDNVELYGTITEMLSAEQNEKSR